MAKTKRTSKDVEDNKVLAAISYLFILCLVPLLGKRDSEYVQFHAKQGLILTICWFVAFIIGAIPLIGFLYIVFLIIINLMALVNALAGKRWELPFLGKYAKKINL